MIKERIAQLMDKEMDRKSFLIHMAAGAVALVGVSAVLRAFTGGDSGSSTQADHAASAYGGSPYGR